MAKEIKITPLNGNVLIYYEAPPQKTASGLSLPKPKHEGLPSKGVVKAVADDVDKVKVGDRILFKYNMNRGINFQQEKLIVVPFEEIVGIITEG